MYTVFQDLGAKVLEGREFKMMTTRELTNSRPVWSSSRRRRAVRKSQAKRGLPSSRSPESPKTTKERNCLVSEKISQKEVSKNLIE